MNVRPSPPAERGPADWFTGEVLIEPITGGHGAHRLSLAVVHFAAGARTAWHAHSVAQTLHVAEGEGWVQARGQEVVTIRPGDVVEAVGGEWHWHGATRERGMSHLSLAEGETEWGDHVTDREYSGR